MYHPKLSLHDQQEFRGERDLYVGEIDALENQNLIHFRDVTKKEVFSITPIGLNFYDYLKSQRRTGTVLTKNSDYMDFKYVLLGTEQKQLLQNLVEDDVKGIEKNPGDRNQFIYIQTLDGKFVRHFALENSEREVNSSDIEELSRQNLINFSTETVFYITPQGFAFNEYLKKDNSDQVSQPESDVKRPLTVAELIALPYSRPSQPNFNMQNSQNKVDPRKVFVIHGRNEPARKAMFAFLRSLDLRPIEWEEAVRQTNKPAPYIGEILDVAFNIAQAVVVLLTGDDEAKLRDQFQKENEDAHEKNLTPQARPNVIFEAGMAFGRSTDRTVLVQVGKYIRPFSDVAGRHTIHFGNNQQGRIVLKSRLEKIGCQVDDENGHWLTEGDFSEALDLADQPSPVHQSQQTYNAIERLPNGNLRVLWNLILQSPEINNPEGENFRRVSGVGEVWVTKNHIQLAESFGNKCIVELVDATAASSQIPQFAISKLIP